MGVFKDPLLSCTDGLSPSMNGPSRGEVDTVGDEDPVADLPLAHHIVLVKASVLQVLLTTIKVEARRVSERRC